MMARTRGRQRDRGVALVEFALVLPVLLMLLLGLVSGGFALNEKQQMTHAVREGARYGATVPADQDFTGGTEWADAVQALIVERSIGSLSSADVCVSLVEGSPGAVISISGKSASWFSTNGSSPCIANQTYPVAADGTDTGRRVQVTATKPATIQLGLFGAHSITLDSVATAKSESNL